MKQGTVSVLFGCHSVIHSLLVLRAWRKLYGRLPAPWETACIFLHDVGHWGRQYLDDVREKNRHWELGARIAGRLFGRKGFDLAAGHCRESGHPESRLLKPDKYSWVFEPYWWAWWNALVEPKLLMGYTLREAYARFHARVRENIESGAYRDTHNFFLEKCISQREEE